MLVLHKTKNAETFVMLHFFSCYLRDLSFNNVSLTS